MLILFELRTGLIMNGLKCCLTKLTQMKRRFTSVAYPTHILFKNEDYKDFKTSKERIPVLCNMDEIKEDFWLQENRRALVVLKASINFL